jgi:hypothetical protein
VPNIPYAQKSFWTHPMVLQVDQTQLEARFGLFRVLILTQDRCRVCTECTIDSEIILDLPDGTPRLCGSRGISFRSV